MHCSHGDRVIARLTAVITVKYINVESQYRTPETNVILYTNYT